MRTPDGLLRELPLRIHFLPDLLLYLSGFVGFCGSLLLTAYLLFGKRMARRLSSRWLLAAALILATIGTTLRLNEPAPPLLEETDGQITARMWAEQGILVFPHECVEVEFSVAGAQTLRFNDKTVALEDGWAQRNHCDWQGGHALLDALDADGKAHNFALAIPSLFGSFSHLSIYFYICIAFMLAGFMLYAPMAVEWVRHAWRQRQFSDFAVLGCFAFVVLMLHLPFGFDGAPQFETWGSLAYHEGRSAYLGPEYMVRLFPAMPRALAMLISSETFVGHHLVHVALLFGRMALLYGILRKLNIGALYACLIALLALAWPVNDLLLSLRSLPLEASVFWLLLAACCALEYWQTSRRRALCGMCLALLLNVESYEAGLALLLALPAFLWLRPGNLTWRAVNLYALWICAAVYKVGKALLLLVTNRSFYGGTELAPDAWLGLDTIATVVAVAGRMYGYTFVEGWREALATLAGSHWLLPICLSLLGALAVSCLTLRLNSPIATYLRATLLGLLGGLLFLAPAIAVLMWLPKYSGSLWRLSLYVPFGAASALFCLLLLLTHKLRRWRDPALVGLCLLLLLPGLARLYDQHDDLKRSADIKAAFLYDFLQIVPHPNPDTHIVLITAFSHVQLEEARLSELTSASYLKSALRVLYQDDAPASIFVCHLRTICGRRDRDAVKFRTHSPGKHLKDTLLLELREDFTLAIVDDPAAYLGWDMDIHYDAARLYDADAPLPPRARTMLGLPPSVPRRVGARLDAQNP